MSCDNVFNKDPDETLDYGIDWSSWLLDDTIISSLWIVPDGLTESLADFDDTFSLIWLSGGDSVSVYEVTNRITTAEGRIKDQTIFLRVEEN